MQISIKNQQQGMITLVIALMLLLIISMITLMVAKSSMVEQRISANQFGARQAFAAAQAGMQFALPYLNANISTIVKDANSNGYIDSYSDANTLNVSLSNSGGTYTIIYSNPIASNFNLVDITVVGTSANGLVNRTIKQTVYAYNSGIPHPGTVGLVAKSIVALSGIVNVNNTATNKTIQSGGVISSTGIVSMTTSSGSTNNPNNAAAGANMNNTALQGANNTQLFQNFFGSDMATVQSKANINLSGGGNYSATLNGQVGKIIYINGNASFNNTSVIGSSTQPVILIVNGQLDVPGNLTVNGFVYSVGNMNLSGNITVNGVSATAASANVSGIVNFNYNTTVVNNLTTQWKSYTPVAGSWRDF